MTTAIAEFPAWAKRLSEEYLSGASNLFLLHGNIDDWVPRRENGKVDFVGVGDFLKDAVFGRREIVIQYDQASGLSINKDGIQPFFQTVQAVDAASGTQYAKRLPRQPAEALFLLDRFVRSRSQDGGGKVAIVLHFAQMVAPKEELSHMTHEDFRVITTMLKWANDPELTKADITFCLIAPNLGDLNPSLVTHPFTSKIELPLPDEQERLEFIGWRDQGVAYEGLTRELLAKHTNALSRIHLDVIFREARRAGKLDLSFVAQKKKELIEKACFGLLEFLQPKFTMDQVEGLDSAKKRLRDDIKLLKSGHHDALPIGYLFCGPVGTGKSFLATCAIGEIGIPCVRLLNFREKWVGATEANLEKILMTLRALGPVGVIIDEADAFMGNRSSGDGDSGLSNRVFSQFATQMGDTTYRGKILWFLLTCRPDFLPVDIKRQGRIEVHVPLFYPRSDDEKVAMFVALARKEKWPLEKADVDPAWFKGKTLSGADTESVIVQGKRLSLLDENKKAKKEYLRQALTDFIPATNPTAVRMQELIAVIECTDRNFLPPEYLNADRDKLSQELDQLKARLGER